MRFSERFGTKLRSLSLGSSSYRFTNMGDTVVLKYKDVVLRESDLDTLRGPCFLNDQIIAFYFSYLASSSEPDDILLVEPSVCSWLANCEDDKDVSECAESRKLSSKRLVVFAVNDCDYSFGDDGGSHWSILVYDRTINAFLHHDSMKGANNFHAEKLYNAVKNFMGPAGEVSRMQTASSSKKQRNKKKSFQSVTKPLGRRDSEEIATAPAGLPIFKECQTPQQSNAYDCGIYVLAIARAISEWFLHERNSKSGLLAAIKTHVDDSVELKMRREVLAIIQSLRKD